MGWERERGRDMRHPNAAGVFKTELTTPNTVYILRNISESLLSDFLQELEVRVKANSPKKRVPTTNGETNIPYSKQCTRQCDITMKEA